MTNIVRSIMQLDGDVKPLLDKLREVNKGLGDTNTANRESEKQLQVLLDKEKQLMDARQKSNNPTAIAKYSEEIRKVQKDIDGVTASLNREAKAQEGVNKQVAAGTKQTSTYAAAVNKAFNKVQVTAFANELRKVEKELKNVASSAPDVGKPVETINEETPKAVAGLKALKKEYRDLLDLAIQLGEDTPGGIEAQKKAAELKDRIDDLQSGTKALSQDFKNLDGAIQIAQGIAGAFGAVQGVQALVGDENEDLQKSLVKLQGTMAIFNGLQQISVLLQKNEAGAILLNTIGLKIKTVAMNAATIATRAWNAALMANPLILIGGLIFAATASIIGFTGSTDSAIDSTEELTDAESKDIKAKKGTVQSYKELKKSVEDQIEANNKEIESIRRLSEERAEASEFQAKLLEKEGGQSKQANAVRLQGLKDQEDALRKQILLEADNFKQRQKLNKGLEAIDIDKFVNDQLANLEQRLKAGSLIQNKFFEDTEKLKKTIEEQKAAPIEFKGFGDTPLNQKPTSIELFIGGTQVTAATDAINKDFDILQQTIKDRLLLTADVQEEANNRAKDLSDKIKNLIHGLRDELQGLQDDNAFLDIEKAFADDAEINARFNKQKEILNRELEERRATMKKEKTLTAETADLLVQIQLEANNKLEKERTAALEEFAREREERAIETANRLTDLEIQLSEIGLLTDVKNFDARLAAAETYYSRRIALAKKLGESEQAIHELELERDLQIKRIRQERLKAQIDADNDSFDESQRHSLAILRLERATELEILEHEIAFEETRLAELEKFHGKESIEYQKQKNKVEELQLERDNVEMESSKERTIRILEDIEKVLNETINAANTILAAKIHETETLINLQQQRVDAVTRIAEDGNAELLEEEQKRLDDLNREKERFVRQQQALAVVELIANTAVAIAKAAAEGGVAAPITIASTLIALIAGLAQARNVAQSAAFYEGGEGYTGDGDPRAVSTKLGKKGYTYHKREFIFNHQTTDENIDIFRKLHKGEIDLHDWEKKAAMFDALGFDSMELRNVMMPVANNTGDIAELKSIMGDILVAIKNAPGAELTLDEKGLHARFMGHINHENSVNMMAR